MNVTEQHFYANEISLHFNLRSPKTDKPTPIYAVVRINQVQIKIPTNVRVYSSHWDKKKEQALVSPSLGHTENQNNRTTNRKLSAMRLVFADFLQYIIDNEVVESAFVSILKDKFQVKTNMKKKVKNALLDLGRLIDEQPMSADSRRQYHATLKSFEDFIQETKGTRILGWDEFSLALITDYRDWFSRHVEVHKITKERVRLEDNTVVNKMNFLYTILTYAERKELIDLQKTKINKLKATKSKKTKSEENQIYLTDEEINRLFKLHLEGKEQQVRDLFLFQIEVGQRYSDINGFEADAHSKEITIIQKKTGKRIPDIQLTDTAYQILMKYDFHLPTITNADSNKLIKEIAKKAKINRKIEICETRGGEQYRFYAEAWKLIGTHTARRSFISNCLLKGLDGEIIKKQTGHSTNNAFTRYNRIQSKEASRKIAQTLNGNTQAANPSSLQELKDEIRKNIALEATNQENEKKIKALQQVAAIEETFAEDEKRKRLTLEEAYRQGIPYDLFRQIQREQDEIADLV